MKKLVILLWAICLSIGLMAQDETSSFTAQIVSREIEQIDGSLPITIKMYFYDTVTFVSKPQISLPENWQIIKSPNLEGQSFLPQQTFEYELWLQHSMSNVPFYPQKIAINFEDIRAAGMIYFTPYNTVEIWNLA